jgi:FkbM family methyltransferase
MEGLARTKRLIKKVLPKRLAEAISVAQGTRAAALANPSAFRFAGDDQRVLQCCVAYNEHGGYCIPLASAHRMAPTTIFIGQVHEPDTIRLITSHCGSGDVVHAGTYFGDFIPALSRGLAPGAKVWAFEPDAENHRCADITIRINGCTNVELTNAALGACESSNRMATADQTGLSFGGAKRLLPAGASVDAFRIQGQAVSADTITSVRVVSVDDMVPHDRHVSVIQLDVEHFEQEALSGALKTIERCRPILILENVPEQSWMSANILGLGYRHLGKVNINTVFACSGIRFD